MWVHEFAVDWLNQLPVYSLGTGFVQLESLARIEVRRSTDQQGAPINFWRIVGGSSPSTLSVNLSGLYGSEADALSAARLLLRSVATGS